MSAGRVDFLAEGQWQGKAYLGDWRTTSGGTMDIVDPATRKVLGSVGIGNPQDIAAAARAAREAQPAWAVTLPQERAAVLRKAADLLEQHADELVGWIMRESGSTLQKGSIEIEHSAGFVRHAASVAIEPNGVLLPTMDADRSNYAERMPHGVVGVISPFNFPLVLSIRVVAAALAVGNAVVHKPDLRTAVSGGIIIARLFQEAGLPSGLLQVIPGDGAAGMAMCIDPHIEMISFTGSGEAGSKVGEVAGRHLKKVQLELGGKNALIVLDDADVDVAASNAAWGSFLHQGQICMATGLVLAHERIAADLAENVAERARRLRVGDPSSRAVALGPIISDAQVEKIDAIVHDAVSKGARLLAGGTHDGRFYQATVLAGVKPGMRAFDEEIFGPVACFASFATDDEAVALANRSEYGLAAGVISGSSSRARGVGARLAVGHLHINDQTVNAGPFASFGGRGRSGNGSRISGPAIWEEFTQWRWTSEKAQATPYPF